MAAMTMGAFAEPQQLGDSTTTWEFADDVLVIGGTGDMPVFESSKLSP